MVQKAKAVTKSAPAKKGAGASSSSARPAVAAGKAAPAKKTAAEKDASTTKTTRTTNASPAPIAKAAKKPAAAKAAPAKKSAPAKAAPAKAAPAKKAAAQKPAAAGKAASTRGTSTKATSTKATSTKASPRKAAPTRAPARKTASTRTMPARTTPAKKTASPASLRVRDDESPWTARELRDIRAEIDANVVHLREEIVVAEADLVGLMRDAGDGAGDDQADAGAKTFEREQEISLANNAREMLEQNLHAIERLNDGSYGICESCGNPIGKLRLQAAPRATLCVTCKTKQERR
jgi:RNA polymerase-binding protein DksA